MTPSLKPMETFLNLHAHRPAASSSETVIRNYILPLPPAGHEEPEYGQAFSAGIHNPHCHNGFTSLHQLCRHSICTP